MSEMAEYLISLAVVGICTAIAVPLRSSLALSTFSMLYLLGVIVVSMRCGRRAAVLNALLSVTSFYYFCVPVHDSFVLEDSNYIITLAVMLIATPPGAWMSRPPPLLTSVVLRDATLGTPRRTASPSAALAGKGRPIADATVAAPAPSAAASRARRVRGAAASIAMAGLPPTTRQGRDRETAS